MALDITNSVTKYERNYCVQTIIAVLTHSQHGGQPVLDNVIENSRTQEHEGDNSVQCCTWKNGIMAQEGGKKGLR